MKLEGAAVILLVDNDEDIGVAGQIFLHPVIYQLIHQRCAFVEVKTMGGVNYHHPIIRALFSRQPPQQAAHRGVAVQRLNMIAPDQLHHLLQRLLIFLEQKRRTGDIDMMDSHPHLPQPPVVSDIRRLIHIGGIMHHIAQMLEGLDIFPFEFPQKILGGGEYQNMLFHSGPDPPFVLRPFPR